MEHVGLDPVVTKTGKRTRSILNNHPDWEEGKTYKSSQSDDMGKDNMFGPPCRRPPESILLRTFWAYFTKHSGKRKPINCFDGYPLTRKSVCYSKHYAACASQHGFNIFIDLSTALIYNNVT